MQRRAVITGTGSLLLLVALSIPLTSLRFGYPDAGTAARTFTSRRAHDLVSEEAGQRRQQPTRDGGRDQRRYRSCSDVWSGALEKDPGVADVLPVRGST